MDNQKVARELLKVAKDLVGKYSPWVISYPDSVPNSPRKGQKVRLIKQNFSSDLSEYEGMKGVISKVYETENIPGYGWPKDRTWNVSVEWENGDEKYMSASYLVPTR